VSVVLQALYEGREVPPVSEAELDVLEASALGLVSVVGRLLSTDPALAGARSEDGFTPLHYACFFGGPDVAALLLRAGADSGAVAANAMRVQPLHSAVASRRLDVVRLLVAAGADVDAQQHGGYTALQAASLHDLVEIAGLLLAAGADPSLVNDDGDRARDLAERSGSAGVLALLDA
jgi:ankyrin repeat protein